MQGEEAPLGLGGVGRRVDVMWIQACREGAGWQGFMAVCVSWGQPAGRDSQKSPAAPSSGALHTGEVLLPL